MSQTPDSSYIRNQILKKYSLCVNCINRQINTDDKITISNNKKNCELCNNIYSNIDKLSEYQYSTFQIGVSLPTNIIEFEDKLRSHLKLAGGINIKSDFVQKLRNIISSNIVNSVDYYNPDIVVKVQPLDSTITVYSKPVHLYGRYVKKIRGVKQRNIACLSCNNIGCELCSNKKIFDYRSFEDFLSSHLLKHFKSKKIKFTWIGSEDMNSLVIGNGRPFYADVFEPKLRSLINFNLDHKNDIYLNDFVTQTNNSKSVNFIFESFVKIIFAKKPDINKLESLTKIFKNREVDLIPIGKNKVIKRTVYQISIKKISNNSADFTVKSDGGVSIKALVGESGFSKNVLYITPNISEIIDCDCQCSLFDITNVYHNNNEI